MNRKFSIVKMCFQQYLFSRSRRSLTFNKQVNSHSIKRPTLWLTGRLETSKMEKIHIFQSYVIANQCLWCISPFFLGTARVIDNSLHYFSFLTLVQQMLTLISSISQQGAAFRFAIPLKYGLSVNKTKQKAKGLKTVPF